MKAVTITQPAIEDISTLWKWGEENRELWASEQTKWYSKKALQILIEHPGEDIFLTARVENLPVGMCLTRTLQEWAYLESLYVNPDNRHQGIGKKLVEQTVNILKTRNIKNLSLQPQVHNLPAITFYKKLGFSAGFQFIWMEKKI